MIQFIFVILVVLFIIGSTAIGIGSTLDSKFQQEIAEEHLVEVVIRSIIIIIGLGVNVLLIETFLDIPKLEKSIYPNQGTWNAAKNFVIIWCMLVLGNGIIYSFATGFILGVKHALSGGLIFGIASATLMNVGQWNNGAKGCIEHIALRFDLWRSGVMPWNYRKFLDYAAGRMLLKKDGGTYAFYHPSLQEYFAKMNASSSTNLQ